MTGFIYSFHLSGVCRVVIVVHVRSLKHANASDWSIKISFSESFFECLKRLILTRDVHTFLSRTIIYL